MNTPAFPVYKEVNCEIPQAKLFNCIPTQNIIAINIKEENKEGIFKGRGYSNRK